VATKAGKFEQNLKVLFGCYLARASS